MADQGKPIVSKQSSFDLLEIRLGRVLAVQDAEGSSKSSYRMEIDFGKFGRRVSVGRFTTHRPHELVGTLVVGILNFDPRPVGNTTSDTLILGVQIPGTESGEATALSPLVEAKIGGKIF